MNDLLLDYALNQLPKEQRAEVARLVATDPAAAARLRTLTALLAPLSADREPAAPPPGLALAAIAFTAEHVVANGLFTTRDGFHPPSPAAVPNSLYRESRWLPLVRGWANAAAVAVVVVLTLGLGLTAIQKARQSYQMAVCHDHLRELHAGLTGYSDTHDGRFPQAGTPTVPTAGAFYAELERNGQPVSDAARRCPLAPADPTADVGYAYSLGFRDPLGRLNGLKRPDTADDLTPIVADLPAGGHRGWNVLCVGGAVQFTRTSTIAATGDDIFRNAAGRPAAGLFREDVSLGRPFDVP